VRANRARLVAACLTLCQAWIAAGRPRGGRSIGSFENWAHVLGGVLEVAGIPGFLGNLEEMMESSDSEGAAWNAFIAAWWDRFGTAPVLSADLFDVALFCDPQPPLAGGNERAQKTAFGKAISRMRDRIFRIGSLHVRVRKDGIEHKAARWKLVLSDVKDDASGANQPVVGEHRPCEGNIKNGCSPVQPIENIGRGERGEHGEHFSTLTHTRTRAHTKDGPGTSSPCSPRSQIRLKSDTYGGEHSGEHQNQCSPSSPRPDWLKELDP